jgi:polyphosphate kinase
MVETGFEAAPPAPPSPDRASMVETGFEAAAPTGTEEAGAGRGPGAGGVPDRSEAPAPTELRAAPTERTELRTAPPERTELRTAPPERTELRTAPPERTELRTAPPERTELRAAPTDRAWATNGGPRGRLAVSPPSVSRAVPDAEHAVASAARLGVKVGGDLPPVEVIGAGVRHYINRELSTLDFNRRVLALAQSPDQPLLERLKYLAIFSSNTDEFFQVRVAGLKDQLAAGVSGTAPDGLSVTDQLKVIRAEVIDLFRWRHDLLYGQVLPQLAERGLRLSSWDQLDEEDRRGLEKMFQERIFPVLTPLAVDPGHPFPYISNLSLNLAVIVRDPVGGEQRFARLKVPPLLPGFLVMPDGERFVPLEQVIAAHLDSLFPGMDIESHHPFRVTRNVDLTLEEDEADDLLLAVELELRRRRFGRAVRLEIDASVTEEVRDLLTRELDLEAEDVYDVKGPLDLGGLWAVHDLDRPELKDEPFVPVTPAALVSSPEEPVDVFAAIRAGDILVHHPYDSFAATVEAFVTQAAADPQVLAIKQTLYRTSGDSPVVQALIRAAEQGKQVAALVELKARGDEAANIGWARALERAGVHVVYGLVGLKTHSKTALVVRQEGDGIRRYCHIGTGNYNSTTARLYEDLGILTAAPDLGADLTDLFNYLTGYSRRIEYRRLLVAPTGLRSRMVELIGRETALGDRGRIVWKLNSLVDREIIDSLYVASTAGVQIDLVTRSICCLRPRVPGLSDNIRVRSLVGRWLEHSRIYYFGAGAQTEDPDGGDEELAGEALGLPGYGRVPDRGEYYLGSADMMERNLDRRVEAVVPVPDGLHRRLRHILEAELADDVLAWELGGDGTWSKVPPIEGFNAQQWFQDAATGRERRRRDVEARRPEGP